jgi:hypothetical protein
VQRAPGIPHALEGGETTMHDSGAARREIANAYLDLTSLRYFPRSEMDCFAEPVIGRGAGEETLVNLWLRISSAHTLGQNGTHECHSRW